MSEVEHVEHDGMCCDQHDHPHVHIEGQGDTFSFRVGRWEFRGKEQAVVAAVDVWLQREGFHDE